MDSTTVHGEQCFFAQEGTVMFVDWSQLADGNDDQAAQTAGFCKTDRPERSKAHYICILHPAWKA